jgi:hypothetical protein
MVGGSLRVLRLLPPLKLVAMTVFSFEAGNRHISPAMNFPSMGLMFKN